MFQIMFHEDILYIFFHKYIKVIFVSECSNIEDFIWTTLKAIFLNINFFLLHQIVIPQPNIVLS